MATVYMVPVGPLYQALTDTGAIGNGYKLYTYVGGTVSTPQTTYTDSTGTVANSNPIILGSNGRFQSVNVWVTTGVTLKLVLTDSTGATITGGTIDNVPAINNANATGINYTATGSSTTRSVATKLGEFVSVKDFGATGDGSTDDTSAITAALAASFRVYFPTGTYKVTSALVVADNTYISGDGPQKSKLMCATGTFTGVFLRAAGRTTIENLGVVATGAVAGTGIRAADSSEYSFTGHIRIKNVYVYGFAKGVDVNNIFDMTLDQVEISNCTVGANIVPSYSASFDSGYFTTITFNKCYIYGCTSYGLFANPTLISKCLTLNDTVIEANTGATAQANIINTNPLVVTDCYFELVPASPAIRLASCSMLLRGGYFNGSGGLSLQATSNDVSVEGYYGTSSTDVIYANGTTLQSLRIANSTVPGTSTLNASKLQIVNSTVNATTYRQYASNLDLSLTDGDLTNTSRIASVVALKRTASVTVTANTTTAVFTDVALNNTWNSDFTVGVANWLDSYNPGLILTVQCATTGSAQYISVLATNTTGSTITITSKSLRILLFKGTAMAI